MVIRFEQIGHSEQVLTKNVFVRICSNDQFARMTIQKRSQNDRTNKHRTLFCRALLQKRPIICLGNFDLHPHTHNTRDVWADQLENRLRWSNSQKLALLVLNRDYIVIESWWYKVSFTGLFCKRDLFGNWEFPKVGSIVIESWLCYHYDFIVITWSLLFNRYYLIAILLNCSILIFFARSNNCIIRAQMIALRAPKIDVFRGKL